MTTDKLNIYQRLHAIMQDIGYIQKEDKKVNNMYTFVKHDAVTAKIRPFFLKHGVMAIPNFFDISQDGNKTLCSVGITFINIDDPEDQVVIDCAGFGQGIDPQDKGAGKAMSYAYKYALLKVFALETGDDPEKDNIDHVTQNEEDAIKAKAQELEEKQEKAKAWVKDYLKDFEHESFQVEDLMVKQEDNTAWLKRIAEGYPDLHKVIVTATDKVRGE